MGSTNMIGITLVQKYENLRTSDRYLYPHGQFGTQVSNKYFNYCKVILQFQQ